MADAITLISKVLSGLPQHGVLEGREILAGGATTGLYGTSSVLSDGVPAGAQPSSTMGNRVGPEVAPLANISRASGTKMTFNPTLQPR